MVFLREGDNVNYDGDYLVLVVPVRSDVPCAFVRHFPCHSEASRFCFVLETDLINTCTKPTSSLITNVSEGVPDAWAPAILSDSTLILHAKETSQD